MNRHLEHTFRILTGGWPYITNLLPEIATANFVVGVYHQLWHIEQASRMSKHDLAARLVFAYQRESIEAHLSRPESYSNHRGLPTLLHRESDTRRNARAAGERSTLR